MTIYLPELTNNKYLFPDLNSALSSPDGLLAMGGCLSPERIINAYRNGIFPWFSQGEPILWWSPSKRASIAVNHCHISKSMRRLLNKNRFKITLNQAFEEVIHACALPRKTQSETWILPEMIDAYLQLFRQGKAHSVEVWLEGKLVGGLYGVAVGTLFCGESMFSTVSNSSKIAFIALNTHLKKHQGEFLDCQMQTAHLQSLGVKEISRQQFVTHLLNCKDKKMQQGCWQTQTIFL